MRSVTGIGQGTDHAAYDVNGELVVRFGTAADPAGLAAATRREAQLLRAVAARSPVPTPVPELVLAGEGCLVYRRLPGVPLLQLPAHRRVDRRHWT